MSSTVVGWPTNVNKIVLSETNGTVGENAVTSQQSESGGSYSILNSWLVPDSFAVSMSFDNDPSNEDANGMTEYDRFENWFIYETKYGTIPFEFPVIMHADLSQTTHGMARYIVPDGKYTWTAEGSYAKVSMTWQQWFYKAYNIENPSFVLDTELTCQNGSIEATFSSQPTSSPTTDNFVVSVTNSSGTAVTLSDTYLLNEGYSTTFKFAELTTAGTYNVTVTYSGQTATGQFTVA